MILDDPEWMQSEECEAESWATLYAIGFALLGAGIVIGAGVGLLISHMF